VARKAQALAVIGQVVLGTRPLQFRTDFLLLRNSDSPSGAGSVPPDQKNADELRSAEGRVKSLRMYTENES
jgi:hypothetical protein